MNDLLALVARVAGVRECLVYDDQGLLIAATETVLTGSGMAIVRMALNQLVVTGADEDRVSVEGFEVLIKRGGGTIFTVVAEPSVDFVALRHRVNVVAIRVRGRLPAPPTASSPPSTIRLVQASTISALEEAATVLVGPVARIWFRRALEDLEADEHSVAFEQAEELVQVIAKKMPDPAPWVVAARGVLDAVPAPRSVAPPAPAARSSAPPVDKAPSFSAALMPLLIAHVGPIGVRLFARYEADAESMPAGELIAGLGASIPTDRRDAFLKEAHALALAMLPAHKPAASGEASSRPAAEPAPPPDAMERLKELFVRRVGPFGIRVVDALDSEHSPAWVMVQTLATHLPEEDRAEFTEEARRLFGVRRGGEAPPATIGTPEWALRR